MLSARNGQVRRRVLVLKKRLSGATAASSERRRSSTAFMPRAMPRRSDMRIMENFLRSLKKFRRTVGRKTKCVYNIY